MDPITERYREHYDKTFEAHGATAKGVDWGNMDELLLRYGKMLKVLDHDYEKPEKVPTLLDVGCGYGGLFEFARSNGIQLHYTGIDIVEKMISHAQAHYQDTRFVLADLFDFSPPETFDYAVCNGICTLKLDKSIREMEDYTQNVIRKMFGICKYGMAINFMSDRVNFKSGKLFYKSPVEMLNFCLTHVAPRVRLDHAYTNMANNKGKLYEYTVYIFRN